MYQKLRQDDDDEKKLPTTTGWSLFKVKYYALVVPLILAAVLLLTLNVGVEMAFRSRDSRFAWTEGEQYEDLSEKNYFIRTDGCTIPGFDPFDPAVIKYYEAVDPIVCGEQPLIDSDESGLWIDETRLEKYGIGDRSLLACCYRPFIRRSILMGDDSDNRYTYAKECLPFDGFTTVDLEFVRVECMYNGSEVYRDFHAFVPLKNKTVGGDRFSVLVIGIDAVSRLNLYRNMPKTVKLLKELGAIDLRGYNKVGDNTYPNLIPVLSGLNESELAAACLPSSHSRFDDCPFVWKYYDARGYYTAWAEDSANIGLFNYFKMGFGGEPTDYYWRTFNFAAESELGHERRLNTNLCIGVRLTVDLLLGYIYKFVKSIADRPYFGFFWETSITHDNLNYPSLADDKYVELLSALREDSRLDSTVLIMISDHGIRWGGIRSTHQGRMEERLPFAFVTLPKAFAERYPLATANLKVNSKRLTTPFDLHETLADLSDVETRVDDRAIAERIANMTQTRGISLFLPIDTVRTCPDAGVDAHWCTCHETRKLDVSDRHVVKVAKLVTDHINAMLSDYVQCSRLNMTAIVDARIAEPHEPSQVEGVVGQIVHDYTVVIHTEPGGGLFESTVRRTAHGWNVTGTVSRINLYGKQSYCVDNFHLKLYCFCDTSIPNIFR